MRCSVYSKQTGYLCPRGECRTLHYEEPDALHFSPNIFFWVIKSRKLKWAGHVARMGGKERWIQSSGGETCGKEPLGRPRHRWKYDIKMDLREVGWGMDWIDLAQERDRWRDVVSAVMNLRVP